MKTICGADCAACMLKSSCGGCMETGGRPFGGSCVLAQCCKHKEKAQCSDCGGNACDLRMRLIDQFNGLGIADMEEITGLYALKGAFINLTYALPGGMPARFWDDNGIYLGNQVAKQGSDRCYGLAANEKYLMVCEYAAGGCDAEIVVFKRWNG